jgi:hypothetical protein
VSTPERDDDAAAEADRPTGQGERRDRRQSDVDAVWADIVARWEDEVPAATEGVAPGRGAEPGPDGGPQDGAEGSTDGSTDEGAGARPGERAAAPVPAPAGPRDHVLAEEAEGYVPPVPPPLSAGGWSSFLPWAGVLGGPLVLVLAALVYPSVPSVVVVVAVAAFVAGAALVVLRLPTRRSDDGDDGAVV